jgi:CBS domain-containing protein
MTMIGEICTRDPVVAMPEATVAAAARLMRQHHVGSVVVVADSGGMRVPLGVVTDRDIVVEVTATDLDPNTITVSDIMRREIVTVRADEDALEAMLIMRTNGVRRLPVVTAEGKLLGVVAFDDLLDVVTEQLTLLNRIVPKEQSREAVERR